MAVVINLSDPGAVPGASTIRGQQSGIRGQDVSKTRTLTPDFRTLIRGRNRIDEGVKGVLLLGMVPPLSGRTHSCKRQLCSACSGRVSGLKYRTEALAG